MMNPITVDADYTLVAGLHRLEAAKLLGWKEVECSVCELDSLHAELAEIDENVIRTGLSYLELSELLARRKKIY
ncbi:MAG: ParB N-terminal domain-containing protein, partial [Oscillospiraceae bacterium]|nr:ParB N-terminal domain-containing protein [Oscillospiraceae bacterium]